jgi:uncharacterized protein
MGLIKSKLKRRLRKKYHLGEFGEFGFEIFIESANLSEKDFDKFYDDFIGKIENLKLSFGGGGCPQDCNGFIASARKHSSPTAEQKEKLKNWLENRFEVKKIILSEFRDARHNW